MNDSRFPDPAAVALDSFKRELVRFRGHGRALLKSADSLLAARAALVRDAGLEVRIEVERELQAVLDMRDDVPFWDRTTIEPRSLKAVER